MSKIRLIVKMGDKFCKMSSVKMFRFRNCERAVTNSINVASCVDKQCISFKNSCSVWQCTKAAVCLLPFLSHQNQFFFFFCFLFQTLELLYRITNGQNVIVIVQKMLDYLKESQEEYAIINLVGKIAELAEKYPFIFLN